MSEPDPATDDGAEGLLDVQRRTYLLSLAAGTAGGSGAGTAAGSDSTSAPTDDTGTAGAGTTALGYGEGGYGLGLYGGAGPPTMPGFENPPRDLDGDGLFEDVNGDGNFNIFDIQSFFEVYQSSEVQQNKQFFKFGDDDSVDIFDVQALFEDL